MALYESDHSRFMREWLQRHPEELKQRASGIALWWDKPPRSTEAMKQVEQASSPTKAYYYDVN